MKNSRVRLLKLFDKYLIVPKKCIEIGVRNAYTAILLLKSFPNLEYYGIDPFQHFPDSEYDFINSTNDDQKEQDKIYQIALEKITAYEYGHLIRKKSVDAVHDIPDTVDIVYIDGNHSYKNVKEDIELYFPKVRKGGLLIGDDYQKSYPGVIRAVNETFGDNFSREEITWWVVKDG